MVSVILFGDDLINEQPPLAICPLTFSTLLALALTMSSP